ncbi:MAG: EVE domain-containing protein [Methylococcaceae bacterium]
MQFWLMKSEPNVFSIDDLARCSNQTESWEGVRNYQARNFMREMECGDLAFFYHSNCKEIGIVGVVKIVKSTYVDGSAFDEKSPYFDKKSTIEKPSWCCVDVQFVEKFERTITLHELKTKTELADFQLVQRGNRLSILPVTETQWQFVLSIRATP